MAETDEGLDTDERNYDANERSLVHVGAGRSLAGLATLDSSTAGIPDVNEWCLFVEFGEIGTGKTANH